MTHESASEKLNGRERRKLGNNTYLERRGENIAVRLHNTDVLTFRPDGSTVYNSGGWQTVTTKDRMNAYGPKRVYQTDFAWYVASTSVSVFDHVVFDPVPFVDGLVITADGRIELPEEESFPNPRFRGSYYAAS